MQTSNPVSLHYRAFVSSYNKLNHLTLTDVQFASVDRLNLDDSVQVQKSRRKSHDTAFTRKTHSG